MGQIRETRRLLEDTGLDIIEIRCAASPGEVSGAAFFIQHHIPVQPSGGVVIEILDHISGVAFAGFPDAAMEENPVRIGFIGGPFGVIMIVAAVAAFGEEEILVGEGVVCEIDILIAVVVIPVEGGSPDVFRSFRIPVDHRRAVVQIIPVVVPDQHFHGSVSVSCKGGTEMIADEITLLIRTQNKGIPGLGSVRLIIHGQSPDGNSFGSEDFYVTAVVIRPAFQTFLPEFSPVIHFPVALHPRGRTPGGKQHFQARMQGQGFLHHGNHPFPFAFHTECFQFKIPVRVTAGIMFDGEIAAVHGKTDHVISAAAGRGEIAPQDFRTHGTRHLGESPAGGLGHGSADAFECLKGCGGIQIHRRMTVSLRLFFLCDPAECGGILKGKSFPDSESCLIESCLQHCFVSCVMFLYFHEITDILYSAFSIRKCRKRTVFYRKRTFR